MMSARKVFTVTPELESAGPATVMATLISVWREAVIVAAESVYDA